MDMDMDVHITMLFPTYGTHNPQKDKVDYTLYGVGDLCVRSSYGALLTSMTLDTTLGTELIFVGRYLLQALTALQ